MTTAFTELLLGKDLRSISRSKEVIGLVYDQASFDELFGLLFHHERLLIIRAADAVEKITRHRPEFLEPHKTQLLSLLHGSVHKELKWHIAQLIPRVKLTIDEAADVWHTLSYWLLNPNESKIVRVNALQGLYDFAKQYPELEHKLAEEVQHVRHEQIPSLQARIRKLKL
ncbi:hypothetical protein [Chryseosolibacter indicus]|uniref:HEAT repeat domain-containing protein n=1 Tax=Chryseosolibacter indicus TaxID=2782351 RepID=A0ABS5VLB7_9BACT|nr:hypothetical protein [Chryseosolibacter indicus]MBT1702171.1 hypothetical protein [Chryseosolibacter indicus]